MSRTFGKLRHGIDGKGRAWWVVENLEPHVSIRLKAIFPRLPKARIGRFLLPDTPDTAADLAWFIKRYPLASDSVCRGFLEAREHGFYQSQRQVEAILSPDYRPGNYHLKPGQVLRHYQAQAVEVLRLKGHLLLGDEVGLGKTFAALGACLQPDALPALVVCQAHLPRQWAAMAEEFTYLTTHLIKGTRPYPLPPADVFITTYHRLVGWVETLAGKIRTIIFDEAQELRTGLKANKGQAAQILADHAAYSIGLTATPIYNYGLEIWNVLDIIKRGCLGDSESFLREWAEGPWDKATIREPNALGTYLRETQHFLRRTRVDVKQELPPVSITTQLIPYDQKEAQKAEDLAVALSLRTLNGSYVEQGQAARELDLMLRHATGLAKADGVAEYVEMILDAGEPVVLVGWHRDVYSRWNERLYRHRPVFYTGTETPAQKEKSKKAFMDGETNLMFLSLRSGIGLNGLQYRGSVVVFGELDWSPQVHHQVIGRLNREGQSKPVLAAYLWTDFGSDPPMMDLLGLKASQSQAIVDPHLGVQQVHADETRIKEMARRFLESRGMTYLIKDRAA
ncbi:MAG: DEAD/DEAH box helicase [Desulfarculus sp.]|nr:DEAD/DEAH box helicase [Desulfarculus sp.]